MNAYRMQQLIAPVRQSNKPLPAYLDRPDAHMRKIEACTRSAHRARKPQQDTLRSVLSLYSIRSISEAQKQNAPPFLEGRQLCKESDDDLLCLRPSRWDLTFASEYNTLLGSVLRCRLTSGYVVTNSLRRNKPLSGVLSEPQVGLIQTHKQKTRH